MKFEIEKKAIKFLKEKNINTIYVKSTVRNSGCCCIPKNCIDVYTKKIQGNFLESQFDFIKIKYDPSISFFFEKNEILKIKLINLG